MRTIGSGQVAIADIARDRIIDAAPGGAVLSRAHGAAPRQAPSPNPRPEEPVP